MAAGHIPFLFSFLLILAAIQGIGTVNYTVTNTAWNTSGGIRFEKDIGSEYILQTLASATDFIWRIFQQTYDTDKKKVQKVILFIDEMKNSYALSYTSNNEIHISASYISDFVGDLKRDFTGVLYHEMTHIWQWDGNGQAPTGLIEGIAEFVRFKAGYAPSNWVQPGEGERWDQNDGVTARFLDYCNNLRNGSSFMANLNKKMRTGYSATYFVDLLGRSVDNLWSYYKGQNKMQQKCVIAINSTIENSHSLQFVSYNL